jgi:hypothetical protein
VIAGIISKRPNPKDWGVSASRDRKKAWTTAAAGKASGSGLGGAGELAGCLGVAAFWKNYFAIHALLQSRTGGGIGPDRLQLVGELVQVLT